MPTGVYVRDPDKIRSYTESEPVEESRQAYATRGIQSYQRDRAAIANVLPPLTFRELLLMFRGYGVQYDHERRAAA